MQSIDFGLATNWVLGPNELDAAEHLLHIESGRSSPSQESISFRTPVQVEGTYIFALSLGRILRLVILVAIVWLVFGKSSAWSVLVTILLAIVGCMHAVWGSVQSWKRFQVRYTLIKETAESHRDVIRYFQEEDRDRRRSTRDILQSLCTVVFAGVLGRVLTSRRFDWLQSLGSKRMLSIHAGQDMMNHQMAASDKPVIEETNVTTSPPIVIAV